MAEATTPTIRLRVVPDVPSEGETRERASIRARDVVNRENSSRAGPRKRGSTSVRTLKHPTKLDFQIRPGGPSRDEVEIRMGHDGPECAVPSGGRLPVEQDERGRAREDGLPSSATVNDRHV